MSSDAQTFKPRNEQAGYSLLQSICVIDEGKQLIEEEKEGLMRATTCDSDEMRHGRIAVDDYDLLSNKRRWFGDDDITALGFLPAAEGLRGLAVLGPIIDHALPYTPWNIIIGSIGVTMFFVLSEFLITGVLLQMQKRSLSKHETRSCHPYRHLKSFYLNRIVRLFPMLFLVICFGTYQVAKARNLLFDWDTVQMAGKALFSLQNTPFMNPRQSSPFEFTWSLACEEQFYLVWSLFLPFIVKLSSRWRTIFLAALIIASLFSRLYAGQGQLVHWTQTWNRSLASNVYKMLMGSSLRLLPLLMAAQSEVLSYIGLVLLAICSFATSLVPSDPHHYISLLCDLTACIATILMLLGTLKHHNAILSSQALRFLGRISYGLYLWTTVFVSFTGTMFQGYKAFSQESVGFLCALVTTVYLEEPIREAYRQRKHK